MESLKAFIDTRRGLTYIEVLVTVLLMGVILGVGLPLTWDFYRNNELRTEADNFITLLDTARTFSMANRNRAEHGIYVSAQQFILYEGASYASRDTIKDRVFPRSKFIIFSGPDDFNFSRLAGTTTAASAVISDNFASTTITINTEGLVQ